MYFYSMVNFDGKCYMFDDRGEGYGCGEGVGFIIFKKFSYVIEDGDIIYVVVCNLGMNQDGKINGIVLLNLEVQEVLIWQVYNGVNLDFYEIFYVEVYGMGIIVGDNVEVRLILSVFNERGRKYDLLVGLVKINVGYLEVLLGLVGLIKVVMVLKKR